MVWFQLQRAESGAVWFKLERNVLASAEKPVGIVRAGREASRLHAQDPAQSPQQV